MTMGHQLKILQALGTIESTRGVPVSQAGTLPITSSVRPAASLSSSSGAVAGYSSTPGTPTPVPASRGPILDYSHAYSSLSPKPAAAASPLSSVSPSPALASSAVKAVQVCFLMDCTGSMGSYIENTRAKIFEIIEEVKKKYPALAVQIAFVGYRDRSDAKLVELQDFTTNISALRDFVAGVTASGGDDAPEEVHTGLREVLKLRWTADVRLLIHFADAPAHGRLYCDLNDNYPENDRDGSEGKHLMFSLARQHIDYYFAEIMKHATAKMIKQFQDWYNSAPGRRNFLTVLPMTADAQLFTQGVVGAILSSVRSSGIK